MSEPIYQGNIVTIEVVFRNKAKEVVEPTLVECLVREPNGTIEKLLPTRDSLGIWHLNIIVGRPGPWKYRWAGTGVVTAAKESSFWVENSDIV
jgi:hypothetical protein